MTKVFEREVAHALHSSSWGVYCHKCPDHPHAIPDKVDFLASLPPTGLFLGLEAKEVRYREEAPYHIVTANQWNCLDRIARTGGLAIVLINFDRVRGVSGRVGFCIGYRYPRPRKLDFHIAEGTLIPRVKGGWDIRGYTDSR